MNESGRHPVNVGHLVMGLALLGLVTVWALVVSETAQGAELRWLMPIPWIVAGVVGLLVSVSASRRRAAEPVATTPAHETGTDPRATEPSDTDLTDTDPTEEIR